MKTFKQRQVRVFISSAFRGMRHEREILVRHVFPEIRRRCFERGIDFVEVDLRWGITKEQVELPICFQQIDLCHPYFIGLLGEYYGKLPEQKKTVCAEYPWIEHGDRTPVSRFKKDVYAVWQHLFVRKRQGYLDRSITELEILYALFDPKRSAQQRQAIAEKALFYFRSPYYAETLPVSERQNYIEASPKNRAKQQKLKQRLRDHGCHIVEYQQPMNLKALVLEALWERIEREFPDTPTPQQREDFYHDAFAASRQSVYIKRQTYFDRLTQHALSDEPPLVIVGESGGGKSALFANWAPAYRQAHPDDIVFWHFCGRSPGSTDPIALLRRIMASLKSHFQFEEELPTTLEAVKEQFPLWLAKAQGRVILIIDGLNQLEETDATRSWLPDFFPDNIRVFLSTLSTERQPASWQTLNLPLLAEKSVRQALIMEYFKWQNFSESSYEMQRLLDVPQTANPLYLKVILDELRKLGQHLDAYLQAPSIPALYQKVLARLEEDYQPPEAPHLVEKALSLLWAAQRGLHESELLTLLKMPQAIWSPLYLALQNALVSRAGLLNFCHDYLRQAVEVRYLSSEEKKQAVHRQLADYFEQLKKVESRIAGELPYQLEQAEDKQRLQACISEMPMFLQFIKDDKKYELWGYWLRLGTMDKMEEAYLHGLADYEKTVSKEQDFAYALNQLGYFFNTVGYSSAAEPLYQRALSISEKVLGPEHPETARSLNNLASLLEDKGESSAAEPLYQKALSISEKVLGPEHPETARSLNNLAYLLKAKGDYSAAEPLYKRALSINEKVLGPEHPDTARSLNNLAYLLYKKGDYSAAEPLYQRALSVSKKVLGPEHPDTARSLNNLAYLLKAKGESSAAEPLYKRALAIYEKVLGPEHPDTARSLNNLAYLLYNKGDYSAAVPLYQRVLSISEKVLGPEHPETAQSLNNLALLRYNKGDYSAAEPLYQRALSISEKVLGPEHPDTAQSLNNLASLLYKKGETSAAEPLYQRALAIYEKVLGPEHPETVGSLNNLAYLLDSKGDYSAAEPLYQRALPISEKVLGPEHPDTAYSLNNLAYLLYSKGDYSAAEPLLKRALEIREKVLGPEHSETALSLNNLAYLLYNKGDSSAAEPLYQRALAIYEKVLGPEHPETARSLNNLASLLYNKGDSSVAEPLLKRAVSISEKVLGPEHPETAQSLNNLASLLKAKGDYSAAEPLYQRAVSINEKVLDPEHPDTARSLNNLASLLKAKGDYSAAEPLYQRVLEIREKVSGPEHPETTLSLNNLASFLEDKGDYSAAEPLYQRALSISEKVLGPEHPETASSLNNLALLLDSKGDYSAAEPLYRRAVAIFEKKLGPQHLNTVTVRKNLDILLKNKE